jgi:hypothetical protein
MSGRELVGTVHYGILDARLMDDQSTANMAHIVGIDPSLRQALNAASRIHRNPRANQVNLNSVVCQRDNDESS